MKKIMYCFLSGMLSGCTITFDNKENEKGIIDVTFEYQRKEFIDIATTEPYIVQIEWNDKHGIYRGQGCIYAQRKGETYICFPKHVLPESHEDVNEMNIITSSGTRVRIFDYEGNQFNRVDGAMLRVSDKILRNLPSLSEGLRISTVIPVGDTIVINSIFNVRGVKRKYGILAAMYDQSLMGKGQMFFYRSEPGDSGSPVVGREGVVGIVVSCEAGSNEMQFITIGAFEDLYQSLVLEH